MRPRTCVGVDLGSRSLKVVWATAHRNEVTWHTTQRSRHPDESTEQLAQKLGDLLRPLQRHRFDIPVLMAVSHSHVRLLTVEVPRDREVPAAIQERVPMVFPFELARCRYQYRLLARQVVHGQRRSTLQVAACDLERLRRDTDLFARIGWIPSHAYPAALALGSLAKAQGHGEGTVFLLDVGATHSVSAVAVDGQVVFAREVSLGTDDLTDALMAQVMVGEQTSQLSRKQAESLRDQVGLLPSDALPDIGEGALPHSMYRAMLQPVLEQWLEEIQRTVTFGVQSFSESGAVPSAGPAEALPKRLLLSGGGSALVGFDRWLEQQLRMPVERLMVGALGEALRLPTRDADAFAVSCGLLMHGGAPRTRRVLVAADANLLPVRSLQIRHLIRTERLMAKGLFVVLVGVWLAAAAIHQQGRPLRRQLTPLEQRWQTLEPVRTLLQTVVTRMELIGTLATSRGVPVEWFKRLANGFPSPIRLTELSVEAAGEVRMVGQAQAREQTSEAYVSELAIWLSAEQVCHEGRLGSSQRNTQTAGLVDFSLTCQR